MTDELQRPIGFDSSSLVETTDDPVFPWITRRDLGYWISDEKLDMRLQRFAGHYQGVLKHWVYSPVRCKVTVRAPFPTDFGSIPRPAWAIVAPTDIRRPAILHDAHYRDAQALARMGWVLKVEAVRYRKLFDRILLESMRFTEPRIPEWKRWLVYYAVRAGGSIR